MKQKKLMKKPIHERQKEESLMRSEILPTHIYIHEGQKVTNKVVPLKKNS